MIDQFDPEVGPSQDPFTDEVFRHLPADVRASLTFHQRQGIASALAQASWRGRHMIDTRLNLSLFFTRVYVVFLVGKDRRQSTKNKLAERRTEVRRGAGLAIMALVGISAIVGILAVMLLVAYLLKVLLDVDLVADGHIQDFLP